MRALIKGVTVVNADGSMKAEGNATIDYGFHMIMSDRGCSIVAGDFAR